MKVIVDPEELRQRLAEFRARGETLAFVPTMGTLHKGHLSLVNLAHDHAKKVAVSIFVNPLQFGPNEDFRIYPRNAEQDCSLLETVHADLVFMPNPDMMYKSGWSVTVHPGPVGSVFEGKIRPSHFQGVLTVVAKLFHLLSPDVAVFGEKDAQQLFLIRRMVDDLNFGVKIISGETVREEDGLAFSSRNAFIKAEERSKASVLYRALEAGKATFLDGSRSIREIKMAMTDEMNSVPEIRLDYATAVSETSFAEADPLPDDIRLIVAGRFSAVRLIDNLHVKTGAL